MDAWEYGNLVNGKKDGVWKLWYESGVPFGYIHYSDGMLHGEARQYGEKTGSLLEIKKFHNNENKGMKMYYPEKKYDKLPDALKETLHPVSSDEPLINEFFDNIPIGAKSFKPEHRGN